jgi:AraC-like DNA-binding protein
MHGVVSHRPTSEVAPYVEALWCYSGHETARQKERVLPTGRFQMFVDLAASRATVSGMRSQHTVIVAGAITSVMGVVFRPGGPRGFFDAPASDFHNHFTPLELVWGLRATQLLDRLHDALTAEDRFRVLESALLGIVRRAKESRLTLHPSVQQALVAFRCAPHVRSVSAVAREAGLSRRRFSQLFREQVGMTPKLYCRLRRFRGVVRQIASGERVEWAAVAQSGGYCDQAHLSHEFRDFSGLTPGDYVAAERPFPNHVRVD